MTRATRTRHPALAAIMIAFGCTSANAQIVPGLIPQSPLQMLPVVTAPVDASTGIVVAPGRPDERLTFPAKDATHVYYATPLEGRAAEQARVESAIASLGAYLAARNLQPLAAQAVRVPAAAAPSVAGSRAFR